MRKCPSLTDKSNAGFVQTFFIIPSLVKDGRKEGRKEGLFESEDVHLYNHKL